MTRPPEVPPGLGTKTPPPTSNAAEIKRARPDAVHYTELSTRATDRTHLHSVRCCARAGTSVTGRVDID